MLKIFKNLFSQGRKKLSSTLKPNEVEQFIEENTGNKVENFRQQMEKRLSGIRAECESVIGNMEKLEHAELHNKNIQQRLIDIMDGNRKAYIAKVFAFFSQIAPPEGIDPEVTANYINKFREQLFQMSAATAKPYYVLQEFFAHESHDVAMNVKKAEVLVREIDDMNKESPLKIIKEIGNSKDRLAKQLDLKVELTVKISEAKQEILQLEETRKNILSLAEKVKAGEGYIAYNELQQKKQQQDQKIKEHNNPVEQNFAVLERSLRKYERMSLEPQIVQSYLQNPIFALKQDDELKVVEMLEKVKSALLSDKIEEKKREKCVEIIDLMGSEYFTSFLIQLKQQEEEKRIIQNHLSMNTVMQQLGELNYKLEHQNQKISRQNQEISDSQQKLVNLKIDELKKEIEEKLSLLTGFNVTLDISE